MLYITTCPVLVRFDTVKGDSAVWIRGEGELGGGGWEMGRGMGDGSRGAGGYIYIDIFEVKKDEMMMVVRRKCAFVEGR